MKNIVNHVTAAIKNIVSINADDVIVRNDVPVSFTNVNSYVQALNPSVFRK